MLISFMQSAYSSPFPDAVIVKEINSYSSDKHAWSEEYIVAEKELISILIDLDGPVEKRRLSKLKQAVRSALEADPQSIDVKLIYATTIWLEARSTGKRMSYLKGLPQKSRDIFRDILDRHPDHARTLGSYALWNYDVIRRGGDIGARALGASLESAEEMWRRSRELAPEDDFLAIQGAYMLVAYDRKRYHDEAISLLSSITHNHLNSKLRLSILDRGNSLKSALENEDEIEIDRLLKAWIGR